MDAGKHAESSVRRGCSLFIIDGDAERLAARQGASTTLDRSLAGGVPFEHIEFDAKTNLRIACLELGVIAETRDLCATNHDRVSDRVGEDCLLPTARKNAQCQNCSGGIFRARKREQIRESCRRIANLSRPVDMIRHRMAPVSDCRAGEWGPITQGGGSWLLWWPSEGRHPAGLLGD